MTRMNETANPSKTKRIIFALMFIIGAGVFFVTTAGPLSGPAMSWDEAMVGLVPGALLMIIGHFLHAGALGKSETPKRAAAVALAATLFMIGLGTALVVVGHDKADAAERELDEARAERNRQMYDPYGGGYGGYDNTGMLERDVEHYETAVTVGYGTLAASLLFALSTALSLGRARKAA